jgi:beta-galactosidase
VANWTPVDFGTYDDASVQVYSNCDEVELFLNGKSLGSLSKPKDDSPRSWDVTFEKGSLKAVAKNNGKIVATDELITACEPSKIILSVDHSKIANNWDDVAFVTAKVVDANGIVCPNVDKLITFTVSEAGKIIAVDNGNVSSHESYQGLERHTYNGQCMALVKALSTTGQITITAKAPDLKSCAATIEIK